MRKGIARIHCRNGMTEAQRKLADVLAQSYMPNQTTWYMLEQHAKLDSKRTMTRMADEVTGVFNRPKVVAADPGGKS